MFHIGDIRLREHGFRIVSRPKDGPALWVRDNTTMTEPEAHKACDRDSKETNGAIPP